MFEWVDLFGGEGLAKEIFMYGSCRAEAEKRGIADDKMALGKQSDLMALV